MTAKPDLSPSQADYVTQVMAQLSWPERVRYHIASGILLVGMLVMPAAFNEATVEMVENGAPPEDDGE